MNKLFEYIMVSLFPFLFNNSISSVIDRENVTEREEADKRIDEILFNHRNKISIPLWKRKFLSRKKLLSEEDIIDKMFNARLEIITLNNIEDDWVKMINKV